MRKVLRIPQNEDGGGIDVPLIDYAASTVLTLTGSAQTVSSLDVPVVFVMNLSDVNKVWVRGDGTAAAVATSGSIPIQPGGAWSFNPHTDDTLSIIGTADDQVCIVVPQAFG